MKKIKVTRIVEPALRDESNYPHVEVAIYSIEYASKQGFLTSHCDGEHYIEVREIDTDDPHEM